MKKKFNFNELAESIKEAIDIRKGIKNPSRSFKFENISDNSADLRRSKLGNLKNRALVKDDSDDIDREKVSEWKPDGDSYLE